MLSILLPFTNERSLLQEAVDSILQQSYKDFELLLIDNAGDAESLDITARYCEKDSRCRLIREERSGISFALNTGIEASAGTYIARMDADDIALPMRLAYQVKHLRDNPVTGVVACRTEVFPGGSANEGYRLFVAWQNSLLTAEAHGTNRFIESPVAHPSVMMRKELFTQFGKYDTGPLPEDYELWLRWMDAGVRFEKLPMNLLKWRDSSGRLSRSHDNYSESAFFSVKVKWLKKWLDRNLAAGRPLIVCGGSRNIRGKIQQLEAAGVTVAAITDVVHRTTDGYSFIPAKSLNKYRDHFLINLIGKRDVREEIRSFIQGQGFVEMTDFVMAG